LDCKEKGGGRRKLKKIIVAKSVEHELGSQVEVIYHYNPLYRLHVFKLRCVGIFGILKKRTEKERNPLFKYNR